MNNMTASNILKRGSSFTEKKINEALLTSNEEYSRLFDAMSYSISSGGKRLRPALLLEFYRLCGGNNDDSAANFAAALEFIHTYSLIHDDLPCMDDDDMRRGKPSCHIAFGEDTALLAGDALLTYAFNLASSATEVDSKQAIEAVRLLSYYAGAHGMVGGQVIDLSFVGKSPTAEQLEKMYSLKTGALIVAAAHIGCIIAGADEEKINAAKNFAQKIGFAFQIVDDILDIVGTEEQLGKPVGSDDKNQKITYATLIGIENAKSLVTRLTEQAVEALNVFGNDADGLIELAKLLTERKN